MAVVFELLGQKIRLLELLKLFLNFGLVGKNRDGSHSIRSEQTVEIREVQPAIYYATVEQEAVHRVQSEKVSLDELRLAAQLLEPSFQVGVVPQKARA